MTYTPIEKDIEPSLGKILEILNPATYTVKLCGHHLDNRIFEISKGERKFNFSSSSTILKGVQNHKEIQFGRDEIVEFAKENNSLFSLGRHILVDNITYDETFKKKVFTGSIYSLSTCKDLVNFDDKFHRLIIPLKGTESFEVHEFQRSYFVTPNKKSPNYISVNISECTYHLYNYKSGADKYLTIDSNQRSNLKDFQKKCFNILLTLGFIKGNLIYDEAFILEYSSDKMQVPENVLFHSTRESIITNQGTFTANPFSVYFDIDFERDENGMIKKDVLDRLNKDIDNFPEAVFSNIATLFCKYEKLQRAVMIYIQSHVAPLEIKIPNYYVAIEAITAHILDELLTEKKTLSPIKDKKLANKVIIEIKSLIEKVKRDKELNDDDFNLEILTKNINKLNAPPNADKLAESFTYIGYSLSEEQMSILKDRNRFLHGSFLNIIGDDNAEFSEGLHCALRLHFMIAVLIYKIAGYSGKIINYAELWSHVTGKKLDEQRLVKI